MDSQAFLVFFEHIPGEMLKGGSPWRGEKRTEGEGIAPSFLEVKNGQNPGELYILGQI